MTVERTVVYLDVDDEITSAAARIRAAATSRVAVVVPPGSRIATSRINFRLLAREAFTGERRLAIVAPDGASRALAASAGLPVFGSVGEYEASLVAPAPPEDGPAASTAPTASPDEGAASGGGATPGPAAGGAGEAAAAAATRALRGPGDGTAPATPATAGAARDDRARRSAARADAETTSTAAALPVADRAVGGRRGPRPAVAIGVAIVGLLLLAGAVGAWIVLPSATVVVTPRVETLGPIQFAVRADPAATTVDTTNGVIPAERLTFDLTATRTFQATGRRVADAKATGSVRWTNCDPSASYRIPAGTIVRTKSGVRFATSEAVFLPVAGIDTSTSPVTVQCQTNDVGVGAVAAGTDGNVDANAITVVPASYNANLVKVTNPAPTSGGAHDTFPKVTQKDVDTAVAALTTSLSDQLAAKIDDPGAIPEGSTAFPTTAQVTPGNPTVDPATLVGQEVATFDLGLTGTGSVVAVDEGPLDQVAAARLRASVAPDHDLVESSITTSIGQPSVTRETVAFPVSVAAREVPRLDAEALRAAIRGRSLDDARAALAPYGTVSIQAWPSWVGAIPTLDARLDLRIGTPSPSAGASPAPSPVASPPASGSGGPSGSSAPAGSASPSGS